jgi:hypothetical protein
LKLAVDDSAFELFVEAGPAGQLLSLGALFREGEDLGEVGVGEKAGDFAGAEFFLFLGLKGSGGGGVGGGGWGFGFDEGVVCVGA